MATTVTVVQADSKPDLNGTLKDSVSGDPIDLSNVTAIRFQMREPTDRRFTVNAAANIVNAGQGRVRYSWGADDLSRPGTYQAQWRLTYSDATVQTTDPPNTIIVRRK